MGYQDTPTQSRSKTYLVIFIILNYYYYYYYYYCFLGGQKARVVFADISLMQPDIIILVSVQLIVCMRACVCVCMRLITVFVLLYYHIWSS